MNLARAFDVSLPELPRQRFRESYFCFNPATIWREHKEPRHTVIMALAAKTRKGFVFTPEQWELVRLFDGRRNYQQIAALWKEKCGSSASPEVIRTFAENLDLGDFWYKTPQEESAALAFDAAEKRKALVKQKKNDFAKIYLWHFDADTTLTRVHRRLKWLWTPAFVIPSVIALLIMLTAWIVRWDEIWRDSLLYWNMTEKTFLDVLAFYLLFACIGFFHESGHALTAKNFGAEVHRTGLMLVYTTPAFFVDSVEVWVFGTRMDRIYTVLAGFWFELMICAVATFVWWATPAGSGAHDFAYKVILVGGIMPVVFNMNPLTKLDGYLCLCEIIRIQNLKEKANAFLSAWVRRHVFRMPVTVPALPARRAIFFSAFAVLSGFYSYLMLMFLSRLTYKIMVHYTPEWAFLVATLVALRIFKSRIQTFLAFCRDLYVSKKAFMTANWKTLSVAGAVAVVLLFVPMFREEANAPFVIEPSERAVLRADAPGLVQTVFVREGDSVKAGERVAGMRSLAVDSSVARAGSGFRTADARATEAQLRNADYGAVEPERRRWSRELSIAADRRRQLDLISPIAGTVVTAHLDDLPATWVDAGTTIAEVQNLSTVHARVFIAEPDMRVLTRVTAHSLRVFSAVEPVRGTLASISATPQIVEPGLIPLNKYKGLTPPPQYVAIILLDNRDGALRSGMSGDAKIFGLHRSVAGMVWQAVADFAGRKFW
jgi:putative peptide zinc metalloprotease protein